MNNWQEKARQMVETQLQARDIDDPDVIQAFLNTPRHQFVPDHLNDQAYTDQALPIGNSVTISQPYTVAKIVQLAYSASPDHQNILDIGSGSGYQSAILSHLYQKIIGIEIIDSLVKTSKQTLDSLNIDNVTIKKGNAREEMFPDNHFSAIVAAAASSKLPPAWAQQLKLQGVIVCPIKNQLKRFKKTQKGLTQESFGPFSFVPLKNA